MEPPGKRRKHWVPRLQPAASTDKKTISELREAISRCALHGNQDPEDILIYLCSRYSFSTVTTLKTKLREIPENFPNRMELIHNMLISLGHSLTMTDVNHCVSLLEKYCMSQTQDIPGLKYISPKISVCLFCNGKLYNAGEPTKVTVFTFSGPVPGLKSSLRCKSCDARYSVDSYHAANGPCFFYDNSLRADYYMASNVVYFSSDLFEFLCEASNHAFVSAQAFAEIYNSVYGTQTTEGHSGLQGRMTRKNTMEVFLNGELANEIRERGIQHQISISLSHTREDVMKCIDQLRRQELYVHDNCSDACKSKGCENLRVVDGCWKLCFPHCMMAVRTELDGYPLLNFPNVCTNEPHPNSVFCSEHLDILMRHKIPTSKKEFLEYIGCKVHPNSASDIKRVDEKVLDLLQDLLQRDEMLQDAGADAIKVQGTRDLVKQFATSSLNVGTAPHSSCNKDTGEKARLRQRSRGHFVAVTGGGHILQFNPLFKSESPSQAFMLMIQMMYQELKDVPDNQLQQRMENYIICYDNICNIEKLAAAKEDLPLPGPFARLWKTAVKSIDRLHIKNHKEKKCLENYHPDKNIPAAYNTMVGEQTFAWMSRFKKIVNSMTQTHHLFYLHRMCIRRNRYTDDCLKNGRDPVLPGINQRLTDS